LRPPSAPSLIAAGLLTSIAPAWQTYAQLLATRPMQVVAGADDLDLTLSVSPGHPGPNTYALAVRDRSGQPVSDAQRAVLRLTFLDQDLGEVEVPLEARGDGLYQAQGGQLGLAGRWQAVLIVRRAGREDARTAVRFDVTPSGASSARQPVPLAGLPQPDARTGLAALAALAGLGLGWFAWRRADGEARRALPGLVASAMVVLVGLYMGARSLSGAPTLSTADLRNPIVPDQASLARGKQIYDADCAVCHGVDGRGDGPAAATLRPPPADLRVHMAAGHTDAQLFNWVTNGVPGTAMPAWKDRLSEEDRWHAINYIRSFAPQAALSPSDGPRAS
jgi:copper transport protein